MAARGNSADHCRSEGCHAPPLMGWLNLPNVAWWELAAQLH